jgi:uncharacterized protein (TIGR02246 family)
MNRAIPVLVFVASAVLAGCAPRVDVAAEEEAVRATSAQWLEYSKARDASGVASLFAEDGAVYWTNRPPTAGPEAIELFMRRQFAENPSGEGSFAPDRVDVAASGDLAVEQGAYQSSTDAGRYVTVYRKVGGEWKVAADMSLSARPHGGAPDWAQESLARWYETFNARNAEGLADLYTADARVGDARGRAAIVRQFRSEWAESSASCSGDYDDFVVVGSIAAGRGRDICTVTPADGGPATTVHSRWLATYERQTDGRWLCIRDYGEPTGS